LGRLARQKGRGVAAPNTAEAARSPAALKSQAFSVRLRSAKIGKGNKTQHFQEVSHPIIVLLTKYAH
jgi:hypothetical protein